MSKYIIEIAEEYEEYFKGVLICGIADGKFAVDVIAREDLEELNSDYINEHYGELQDEAYQRGLEDGKKAFDLLDAERDSEYQRGYEDGKNSTEKGCEGCKYESRTAIEEPCKYCSNCHTSKYTPMPKHSDRIEVGDEVTTHWAKGIATVADYGNDIFYVMFSDGSCGKREVNTLKKTGKHYDIQSILEAMRT